MKTTKLSMLLSIFLCAPAAAGLTYQWPYTAWVDVRITGPQTASYTIHMGMATLRDETIEPDTKLADVMTAKTGLTGNKVVLYSFHRHNNTNPGFAPVIRGDSIGEESLPRVTTFKGFAERMASAYPQGSTVAVIHSGSSNGNECVGSTARFEKKPESIEPFESWIAGTWNGGLDGNCIVTPPASQWCAMVTPELSLDYEQMKIENATGASVSGTVAVQCTVGMKYTLRLHSIQGIALSNGMTANLKANNLPLNSTLTGEAGDNIVNITSTLSGTPHTSGPFEGSDVLFVSYP
ncbi:hypothetical protein [Serratia fonticola]|uniref:hypothetical protein n=1 Tax=Serratia fonticola TaxID=47917 RepID=UPI003AABA71A